MELVPILSTIILVGTIATFILAVFAYILYKARERKSRSEAKPAQQVQQRRQPSLGQQQQPALTAQQQQAMAQQRYGAAQYAGQPSQAAMYISPTTTLPPQGPVVHVDEAHEAPAPSQGWTQPNLEGAVAAPPPQGRQGDGGYGPPRLAPSQQPYEQSYEQPRQQPQLQPAQQQPSSLFWEYTDEGFVPVDPRYQQRRPQQQAPQQQPPQQPAPHREPPRRRTDDDDNVAWL